MKDHQLMASIAAMLLLYSAAHAGQKATTRNRVPNSLIETPSTVLIEGGEFTMGTKIDPEGTDGWKYHADEAPTKVTLQSFLIGKFPVTAEQMCLFLNATDTNEHDLASLYALGSSPGTIISGANGFVPRSGTTNAPASHATWKGAMLFCRWLSDKTGRRYRLPSEAEWEYAARGQEGRRFPWSDEDMLHPLKRDIGPRYDASKEGRRAIGVPLWPSVGSHMDNGTPKGVMDMCAYMIGEWCANKYIAHPKPVELQNTHCDLSDLKSPRVVRGGPRRKASVQKNASFPKGLAAFFFHARHPASHYGTAWTRLSGYPAGREGHGFRVVEELQRKGRAKDERVVE